MSSPAPSGSPASPPGTPKIPDMYNPRRKPRYDLLYIPLAYGVLIPMMRFGLQGRLSKDQMFKVYTGTVFAALGHAFWITFTDSTVL
eukprot:CAMPEP_0184691704 /NCGR_PEP_ID=MMETSP0313-20130426/469_1 /TAXON_ID=2792 /ORGANISM="Porphyridium aerugineum, Strain SAG 1380-2" /LENGTH=86 /DNA_ID=CAMNT_0027149463 /DNA_START=129 /DNA_END=389 /DNA_ORIENTATION=+